MGRTRRVWPNDAASPRPTPLSGWDLARWNPLPAAPLSRPDRESSSPKRLPVLLNASLPTAPQTASPDLPTVAAGERASAHPHRLFLAAGSAAPCWAETQSCKVRHPDRLSGWHSHRLLGRQSRLHMAWSVRSEVASGRMSGRRSTDRDTALPSSSARVLGSRRPFPQLVSPRLPNSGYRSLKEGGRPTTPCHYSAPSHFWNLGPPDSQRGDKRHDPCPCSTKASPSCHIREHR